MLIIIIITAAVIFNVIFNTLSEIVSSHSFFKPIIFLVHQCNHK